MDRGSFETEFGAPEYCGMPLLTLGSSISFLAIQRQLALANEQLSRSMERLTTGLRINRASDDAAGFAVATTLEADRRVYAQAVKNINEGIAHLNVAETATRELMAILARLAELAQMSANGTLSNTQRAPLRTEAAALQEEYNRIIESAEFNDRKVFAEAQSELTVQAGYGVDGRLTAVLGFQTTVVTGDGTFQPRTTYGTGSEPAFVAVADFDGDGASDLVAVDSSSNTLSVLLGNGDGTFQPRTAYATGGLPRSVAVADFDGDGASDLVAADENSDTLSVLLGNGDGTFQPRTAYATGDGPRSVAVADFDGDGASDLVAADYLSDTLSVLAGNGDGTFQPRATYGTGNTPYSVAVGDFDGDGASDLVAADHLSDTLSVFLGNGDGTFQPRTAYATGDGPLSVAVADFDGDGASDLVAADFNSDTLSVLLGNGDGTFQPRTTYATGSQPYSVAVGDFDGDGASDLVAADLNSDTLSVLLGNAITTTQAVTIRPLTGIDLATKDGALDSQANLDTYLDEVGLVNGLIGASLSRFESAIATASSHVEVLAAARYRIMDVDIADEAARLVANRVRRDAALAVLAQANQQRGIALRLLTSSALDASRER
jgi:flagellin-like hook-associated protein FlgL